MARITITLDLPDARQQEVIDALCNHYGYNPSGGLTKAQFLKREIITFIRNAYVAEKLKASEQAARQQTLTDVNSFEIT